MVHLAAEVDQFETGADSPVSGNLILHWASFEIQLVLERLNHLVIGNDRVPMGVSLLGSVARAILTSHIRGRTRLTVFLSRRLRSLQFLPMRLHSGDTIYLDLRLVSTHSLLCNLEYEPHEQALMRRIVLPGDVAFDVGAHIGVHTLLLAKLVAPKGRVVAFEPNPFLLPLLRRSADKLAGTSVLPFALSDCTGESEIFIPADPSMASLADWTKEHGGQSQRVSCRLSTLDDLVKSSSVPRPDFIKCDVEGGELKVFRGARRLLDSVQAPILLFEANVNCARGFGQHLRNATDFLAALPSPAYSFFELEADGTLQHIDSPRSDHANILAVPAARMGRGTGLFSTSSLDVRNVTALAPEASDY